MCGPTRATATAGPRSNFAEFRRQMKLKQTTAVDMTGVVNASPRRAASHSPATTSPRRQSPGGSGKSVINSSNNNISSTYISHSVSVSSCYVPLIRSRHMAL